ncbi:MAG: PfkB family carbohydrate kinase [Asgard group archaeon]|nr:PfkB family carbohydrate kinase [Asgard group archaeon]
MVSIVGVGDNVVDKYVNKGKMFPGGNAVNVPTLAHRYGAKGSYVGWLGNDIYGNLILKSLKAEGVDTSHCHMFEGETTYVEIFLKNGNRTFGKVRRGLSGKITLTDTDYAFITKHDLTHSSIYSCLENSIQRLHEESNILSFDFSSDWTNDYIKKIAPFVDIAILSLEEQTTTSITEKSRWIYDLGPHLVLLTQGEKGSYLFDGEKVYHQKIIPTKVIDTLGAGDAFTAKFLTDYLLEKPIKRALKNGAKAAADTCQYYGAFGHGTKIE